MSHLNKISVARAATDLEKQDPAGFLFFQLWAAVFTTILGTAFKDS